MRLEISYFRVYYLEQILLGSRFCYEKIVGSKRFYYWKSILECTIIELR